MKEKLTLEWDHEDFSFGPQPVGSSTSYVFVISNTGNGSAEDCGSLNLSDPINFSLIQTTCTQAKMAPGESCAVEISAHPTSDGEKNLIVSRECKDGGAIKSTSNQIKVVGVPPTMAWSPTSYDFADLVQFNDSVEQTFTLTNTSSGIISQCGLVQLSNATDFTITEDHCGLLDLTANSSCSIKVQALGSNLGLLTTTLSRSCGVGGTASTDMDLIRVNVEPVFLKWNQSFYDMGNTSVGASNHWIWGYVQNMTTDLATSCTAPVLSDTTNFSIDYDGCDINDMNPGSTCDVYYASHPTTPGVKQATLTRSCIINGLTKTTSMTIQTNGLIPAPDLTFGSTSYNYGDVYMSQSPSDGYMYLYNVGYADATGCSAAVLDNTTDFTISSDSCATADLASQNSCLIMVQALPSSLGIKSATLSRTCAVGGTVSINLSSEVKVATPDLFWSQNSYDYGDVDLDETVSNNFTIYNSGAAAATGCSPPVLSDNINFEITTDGCYTNNVASNYGSCNVAVVAHPQSLGVHSTTLSRTCTVGGTITLDPITVTGVIKTDWKSELNITDFGLARTNGGSSDNMKYYFRNPGGRDVTGCTAPTLTNTNDFSIVSDSCGSGNMPKATICEVQVKANPVVAGYVTTNLTRTCNESTATVQLNSTGIDSAVAIKISSNLYHTCALLSDGQVRCWGLNNYGEAGSYPGGYVSGITNAIDIGTEHRASCALISGGTIKCWGMGNYGQLGNGSTASGGTPVDVLGISNAVKLAIGDSTSCALLNDGTIKCWGFGGGGRLGNGASVDSSTPVVVSGITNAVDASNSCAVLATGEVMCWGYNSNGELGNGTGIDSNVPVFASGINNAVSISSGSQNCALLSTGQIKCWGWAGYGFGGSTPTLVSGINNAIEVIAGEYNHACARLADNTVKCWGGNDYGQVGDGTHTHAMSPVVVAGLSNVTSLALGAYHGCALLSDHKIKCWGDNTNQYLGINYTISSDVRIPYTVSGINTATDVSSGYWFTCALLSDQTVKCWGDLMGSSPTTVVGVTSAVKISSGNQHACSLLSDQTVKCWGSNSYNQLGSLASLTNVLDVSVGSIHACALISNGTIQCWGNNASGQLGDGTTNSQSVPVVVSGIANATKVTSGGNYSCALLSTGQIKCWGTNIRGQLGDGTNNQRETPVFVAGISNAIDVRAGESHTCAILNDQTVKCWGSNFNAELGIGPWNGSYSGVSLVSTAVPGISGAQSLHLGMDFSCATLSSGLVKCWGGNGFGQLGDVTTTQRNNPINRLSFVGTSIQKMGSNNMGLQQCVVNNLNQVVCTGYNYYGQVGASGKILYDVQGF